MRTTHLGSACAIAIASIAVAIAACHSGTGPSGSSNKFDTPDILDNASFETDWGGFTNWTFSGSPTGVARATDYAYSGSYSLRRTWTPNPGGDVGSQLASPYMAGGYDHLWVRFYFRLTAPITTVMKFSRFYNGGFANNLGGFFIQSGSTTIGFGWDQEDASIITPLGLTQAQVIDGNWHSLEVEYWRTGDPSGYPSAAFWFDGNPQSLPDGSKVEYDCSTTTGTCNHSYWKGGRLNAGQRAFSGKMNVMEWLGTLNGGNTTTGQVNIDRVAISSLGRIGP
jgi:hypothetical protein